MENFASYLANLPKTPIVKAVKELYEAVYLPNGQPERLESTRYILVCRDIWLSPNERMNQIYDNALAECDRLNKMHSDEFLEKIGKSASEVRSPMTRDYALDYLNRIKQGASDCKILKSTPSMLAYVPHKDKYGDLPQCVKLCMIKPVQFTGLTSENDPEWSIDPNKRADNRYRRWKRAELGLPYAKDFKDMRGKKPNEYQFNRSNHDNDFDNYVNFAVDSATSDSMIFPDRPNKIEQWVDEKRKNEQSTDINTYENNLYESDDRMSGSAWDDVERIHVYHADDPSMDMDIKLDSLWATRQKDSATRQDVIDRFVEDIQDFNQWLLSSKDGGALITSAAIKFKGDPNEVAVEISNNMKANADATNRNA